MQWQFKLANLMTLLCLCLVPALGVGTQALADNIYSYQDKQGNIHLSNAPLRGKALLSNAYRVSPQALDDSGFRSNVNIYKYVDPNGVIHLTDKPQDDRFRLIYSQTPSLFPDSARQQPPLPLDNLSLHYAPLIKQVAARYGLKAALLHAVIRVESAYNPNATSPKGAAGLMQLMPATAKRYGVTDRYDPDLNVAGGARYLRDLIQQFNNLELALAAYNAGENAVKKYGNQIPPYQETQQYVVKVMNLYSYFQENS